MEERDKLDRTKLSGAFMQKRFIKEEAYNIMTKQAQLMKAVDSYSQFKKLGGQPVIEAYGRKKSHDAQKIK